MSSSKAIGLSVRHLREQLGWSQYQLARKIPLSQKQLSRIETEQVVEIPRATLIRLAEVLREPLVTGEVNRWLNASGYRPYVCPGLPLPANVRAVLQTLQPYPALLLDAVGTVCAYNSPLAALFNAFAIPPPLGKPIVSYLWPSLHTDPPAVSVATLEWMIRRLLSNWESYSNESWVDEQKSTMASLLGDEWNRLHRDVHPDAILLSVLSSELLVHLPETSGPAHFLVTSGFLRYRPDLEVYLLHPMNEQTYAWCSSHSESL